MFLMHYAYIIFYALVNTLSVYIVKSKKDGLEFVF